MYTSHKDVIDSCNMTILPLLKSTAKAVVKLTIGISPLLLAWHYRQMFWPLHGITMAKIAGYVLIPLILAYLGNHFAVAGESNPRRKIMWRAIFFALALAGVLLVVVVEKRIDDDHESEMKEERANLRTVMKQQVGITDNLAAIGKRFDVRTPERIVVRVPVPVLPPTEEEKLRKMSSADFRQYAMEWAKKLRNFEAAYENRFGEKFMSVPAFGDNQAARDAYMANWSRELTQMSADHLNDYKNNFWSETVAIYNELERRYKTMGRELPEPQRVIPFAIANAFLIKNTLSGSLNGPHPIGELADYLELLARGLPN